MNGIHIAPCTLKEANEYVFTYHRHHKPCVGQKFSVSVRDDYGLIHGVAICGRPVSRYLDDGLTLEISRCCTDGTRNACSMLYSACVRAAKAISHLTALQAARCGQANAPVEITEYRKS